MNHWFRPHALARVLCGTIFILVVTTRSALALDQNSNQAMNYPGGIVELFLVRQSDQLPQVKYGIREPVVIEQDKNWRVLIGLALDTLPGEYVIYVKDTDSELPGYSVKFEVQQKSYGLVDQALNSLALGFEQQHSKLTDLDFDNTVHPLLPLKLPVKGDWADFFGYISTVDSQTSSSNTAASNTQNYVSFTATALTTVAAPSNAIVSRIVEAQTPGSLATVYLDHGRGLYSIIAGLTDLSIELGNGIVAGAVIGKLPKQTSVENPSELVWQSVLNGVYVNPLTLTEILEN